MTRAGIAFDPNDKKLSYCLYSGTSLNDPEMFRTVTASVSESNSTSTLSPVRLSKTIQSFSIYYQNARSIRSRINDIYCLLTSSEFDVICITESWLDPSIANSEFIPPNYVTFRSDRNFIRSGRQRGGGVVLAVNAQFSVKGLDMSLFKDFFLCDVVGCKVNLSTIQFAHVCSLHSPRSFGK